MTLRHLRTWHRQAASARRLSKFSNTYMWMSIVITPFVACYLMVFEDWGMLDSAAHFFMYSICFVTFAFMVAVLVAHRVYLSRALTQAFQSTNLLPADKFVAGIDGNAIGEIQSFLAIPADGVRFYIDITSQGLFPAAQSFDDLGEVVMPLPFLKYALQNPGPARAILAHEMAHVKQRDTEKWLIIRAYAAIAPTFLAVTTLIYLVFATYQLSSSGAESLQPFLITGLLRIFFTVGVLFVVVGMRKGMESLADAAALSCTDEVSVLTALDAIGPRRGLSALISHPSVRARKRAIVRFGRSGKVSSQSDPAKFFVVIVLLMMASVFGTAIPNFMGARESSRTKTCIANMRQIDSAKEQWAMENAKEGSARPRKEELAPEYMKNWPVCPSGGEYVIGSLSEPVRCTHGGPHVLPY